MNWKTANWIGAVLLTVMAAVSAAPAWAADANLQVKTKQGKVEGRMDSLVMQELAELSRNDSMQKQGRYNRLLSCSKTI
jgi:hypothetical protein